MIYVDTSLMELAKWNRALNKKNMLRPMFLTIFGEMRMKIENGDTSLVLNIVGGFYFNLDINEKLSHIKTMMLTFENAVLIRDYLDKYLKEWHKTTEINKQTNSESEKMREKFTIAKLLIALKNRNKCQMLSLNSSEQADLIPEVEKLLSELEKLQQENRNAKVDNQELYKEIEKLKSRDKILNGWNDDAAKEIEKLKSENEELSRHYSNMKSVYNNLIRIITLIPNSVKKNGAMDFERAESFIKSKIAEERISGLYWAKQKTLDKKKVYQYHKEYKTWEGFGLFSPMKDADFEWIDAERIETGEPK